MVVDLSYSAGMLFIFDSLDFFQEIEFYSFNLNLKSYSSVLSATLMSTCFFLLPQKAKFNHDLVSCFSFSNDVVFFCPTVQEASLLPQFAKHVKCLCVFLCFSNNTMVWSIQGEFSTVHACIRSRVPQPLCGLYPLLVLINPHAHLSSPLFFILLCVLGKNPVLVHRIFQPITKQGQNKTTCFDLWIGF